MVVSRGRRVTEPRDPEVEHLDRAFGGDEEVPGLQVAMNDRLLVRRGEHGQELDDGRRDDARAQRGRSLLPQRLERPPAKELHDEERRPVLGDGVVQHHHGSRVLDRVGDVALPEKAPLEVLPEGELRVKDLHGELCLVAMRGCEHRGHAADAEHPVEAVLADERRPDLGLRPRHERGLLLVHEAMH